MNTEKIEQQRRLFIVFNRAMARINASAFEQIEKGKVIQRMKAALGILLSSNYYVEERKQYEPTKHSCGCPDYIYRLRYNRRWQGQCKHMIAEIFKERMKQLQYKQLDFLSLC